MTLITLETRTNLARTGHIVTPTSSVAERLMGQQTSVILYPFAAQRSKQQACDVNRRPGADAMSAVGHPAGRPASCSSRGLWPTRQERGSALGALSRAG